MLSDKRGMGDFPNVLWDIELYSMAQTNRI